MKEGKNLGKLVDGVEVACTKTLGRAERIITSSNTYLNQELLHYYSSWTHSDFNDVASVFR